LVLTLIFKSEDQRLFAQPSDSASAYLPSPALRERGRG
jgi:hypothetical protein